MLGLVIVRNLSLPWLDWRGRGKYYQILERLTLLQKKATFWEFQSLKKGCS